MTKKISLTILLLLIAKMYIFSQEFYMRDKTAIDTATFMIWGNPNFSMQIPFGTGYLASTFSFDYCIGLDVTLKTSSNWTFDIAFNYMFGSKIKIPPSQILGDIYFEKDSVPAIFNIEGNNACTLTYEGRYWFFGASIGKIFPVNRWKNSGLWLKMSVGHFGHKIHFTDPNSFFPQIDQKTYRLGYDQRSSGLSLNQSFGYLFMQKKRVLSFYAGIELWEIFSKPNRGYIFAGELAGSTDNLKRRFSGLIGIKISWILPFFEKSRVTTYYYF